MHPRSGSGMGRKHPPGAFTGTGTGKILPRGDGDGKMKPDGEFPIDILMLTGVYYIPALRNSVISLGQLGTACFAFGILVTDFSPR